MDKILEIQSAVFVKSSSKLTEIPQNGLPEFAFIGRSNVGKSSLLNFLVSQKKLAKVSSKPGCTKLINHFLINNLFYFVDLPGYGYAKSSKTDRLQWGETTEQYLTQNLNIKCLFVLLDFSIPPQQIDLEFLSWLKLNQISTHIILTKIDKLNQSATYQQTKLFDEILSPLLSLDQQIFRVSAVKKKGREEILNFINQKI